MKKRKISRVPIKSITSMSDYDIHKLKAADQRRVLVSINREGNKHLKSITEGLNKGRIDDGVLEENEWLKSKIYQDDKGRWKYNRFTTKKNMTKNQMEQQIQDRVLFVESPMTTASKVVKINQQRRKSMAELFNKSKGLQKGDKGYMKTIGVEMSKKVGKVLDRLRDEHILEHKDTDDPYPKEIDKIYSLMTDTDTMGLSVDDWFEAITNSIDAESALEYAKRQAEIDEMLGIATAKV